MFIRRFVSIYHKFGPNSKYEEYARMQIKLFNNIPNKLISTKKKHVHFTKMSYNLNTFELYDYSKHLIKFSVRISDIFWYEDHEKYLNNYCWITRSKNAYYLNFKIR